MWQLKQQKRGIEKGDYEKYIFDPQFSSNLSTSLILNGSKTVLFFLFLKNIHSSSPILSHWLFVQSSVFFIYDVFAKLFCITQ